MNAIIVFNFRNYMHPKARTSMEAAATRWGCDYVELTEELLHPSGKKVHHWWQKTLLYDTVADKYDRVVVLDGDMLVRDDCPNVFQIVPEDHFGVVSRIQPDCPMPKEPDKEMGWYAEQLGMERPPREGHLNGGFVVYTPRSPVLRPVLEAWRKAGEKTDWKVHGGTDQTALSVLLHNMKPPVIWMPWQFNAIRGASRPRKMSAYIYHFTAFRPIHRHIERCEWRVAEPLAERSMTDLDRLFERHGTDKGSLHHYGALYEWLLADLRERDGVRLLEFGVGKGGSLRAWEEYLPKAEIIGVDSNAKTAEVKTERAKVVIGDLKSPEFREQLGQFDVIIDDGDHDPDSQLALFDLWWPNAKSLYVVEDVGCPYLKAKRSKFIDAINARTKETCLDYRFGEDIDPPPYWTIFAKELVAMKRVSE